MTENKNLETQIADDLSAVLKEAKKMGCKKVTKFSDIPLENVETVIKALTENQAYRAIGTVEETQKAMEKQKAKKVIDRCMFLECPTCSNVEIQDCNYCPDCGQKIDRIKKIEVDK